MFKKTTVDFDVALYLNQIIFNNNIESINFNIFNKKGISLSGSFMLELYNKINNNSNKLEINSNDLDIYIEHDKVSLNYLEEFFMQLFVSGYRLVNKKSNNSKLHKQYDDIIFEIYKLYKPSCCPNCQYYELHELHELSESNKYFSLSKYINKIISLENVYFKQKIDIIFINCTIRQLLINTFDFDIIKNFYTLNKVYYYNKDAIQNRIATISKAHFKTRILSNIYELNNFIIRYTKYQNRGFKIFIDNNEITNAFINKIINIVFIVLKIDINTPSYLKSIIFSKKKTSYLIYNFYIKYFYLNEQLMQIIYHPSNINKLLNMNINLESI